MIKVENLYKQFGDNEVLKNISTSIESGEVVSIIGPSGSGKSTFLRCLNLLKNRQKGKCGLIIKTLPTEKRIFRKSDRKSAWSFSISIYSRI